MKPIVVSIDDLRLAARQRLPKVMFEYLDGGAEAEVTLRENCRAFEEIVFRPRNGVFVSRCKLSAKVIGDDLALPIVLAPCGFTRLLHPLGELAAARAAGKEGLAYALSTISGYRLEEVKASGPGPKWYQLYLIGGRDAAEATLARARSAGFTVLVITIDTGAPGMRERDLRNGAAQLMGGDLLAKVRFLPQLLARPRWLSQFLLHGRPSVLPNVIIPGRGPMLLEEVPAALAGTVVTWADLDWIRAAWPGPIVIKGVLTADDARRAADEGAAGVVVSNHGGRQLDGVAASIRALPEVVQAVGGRVEVLMDGGVRRGSDIIKALCLGAHAVMVGRAYAYGLGAEGEAGVARSLEILRAGLERTLKLLGCDSLSGLDRSYLELPQGW